MTDSKLTTHIILYRYQGEDRLYPFVVDAETFEEALEALPTNGGARTPVAVSKESGSGFQAVLPGRLGSYHNAVTLHIKETQ